MIAAGTIGQLIRFATVGILSNCLLYAAYLALSAAGMEPKSAMTILYLAGVAQTFLFNRRWSFHHRGSERAAFLRYCISYGLGYLANLATLALFVDRLGYAHQLVQGLTIPTLAILLFLLQKYWVFRPAPPAPDPVATAVLP